MCFLTRLMPVLTFKESRVEYKSSSEKKCVCYLNAHMKSASKNLSSIFFIM